jgi:hypothetical protein
MTIFYCLNSTKSESESELLYDWLFTSNQFVLKPSPLSSTTSDYFLQLNPCDHSLYVNISDEWMGLSLMNRLRLFQV